MTALTTEARDLVADALSTITANIYRVPPPSPVPPAVAIAADNPWLLPSTIGGRLRVEHRLRLMCAVRDSADNMAQLETLVEDVLVALPEAAHVAEVTAPQSLDTGAQGSLLVAEVRITLHLRED